MEGAWTSIVPRSSGGRIVAHAGSMRGSEAVVVAKLLWAEGAARVKIDHHDHYHGDARDHRVFAVKYVGCVRNPLQACSITSQSFGGLHLEIVLGLCSCDEFPLLSRGTIHA